jgi:hypothetical protein
VKNILAQVCSIDFDEKRTGAFMFHSRLFYNSRKLLLSNYTTLLVTSLMKRRHIFIIRIATFVALIFTGFVFIPSIARYKKPIGTGEELAKIYCATCHLFPEPSLLDKSSWTEHVLPNMGWRLGIRKAGDNPYAEMEKDEAQLTKALNIYPDKALLPLADWQKIVAYYQHNAPEKPLP